VSNGQALLKAFHWSSCVARKSNNVFEPLRNVDLILN